MRTNRPQSRAFCTKRTDSPVRRAYASFPFLVMLSMLVVSLHASPQSLGQPAESAKTGTNRAPAPPAEAAPAGRELPVAEQELAEERTQLNLLGQTDTASGESRRNENVKFNPIDNNALREVNIRVGATATIVEVFEAHRKYFGSEYGARPESPIHVTPTAASAIHGNLFATHNNSAFSARSFFQVGDVRPARENNYGFNVLVPLWKGANFSVDAAQQRVRGWVNGNVLVPNAQERNPLTKDPLVLPIVLKLLSAYPEELPNRPDIGDRALNTNAPQQIDTDRIAGTFDQNVGANGHLVFRYGFTAQLVKAFQLVAGQNPDSEIRNHTARISWNRAWTPRTTTDFSVGFDRVGTVLKPEANSVGPVVSIFTIQRLGNDAVPVDRAINEYVYAGQLRQIRERHSLTAGFSVLRRQFNGREANNHLGTLGFGDDFGRDAITNLRMGAATRYSITIGDTGRGFRNWEMAFYAGDQWRATNSLTLSFGLRYEPSTRPVEVNGIDVVPYGCDCNNIAPSFGFAYRAPGRWGVLRGAYGIHYGQIFPATYGQVRFNPPGNIGINIDRPYLADPLAGLDIGNLPPSSRSSVIRISPDLVAPYSQQYNFSWEPELSRHVSLQFGYVGSRTWKLFSTWLANRAAVVDGIPQTTATVNLRRPDPDFFRVLQVLNASRAYYDAARVSVIVQKWRGWSFEASYWLSKAIDLAGDYTATGTGVGSAPQGEADAFGDTRALSGFHQPHAFLMRGAYELPQLVSQPAWLRNGFGSWGISSVLLLKSGTPFPVFSGSDAPGFGNVDGEYGDRVHVVDPSVLGRTIGNPDTSTQLLPRSAFRFMEPTDPRGNVGRNTFRKGKIANVNTAVSRTWRLSAEKALTFRAEAINLLNTPQFADPERNLASSLFGRISNTLNDGRTFQFQLRFGF